MYVNYHALNKVTIKNKYPRPLATNLFERLTKVEYYIKLDLQSGYWYVHIAKGNESKTTRVTQYEVFEFLVMPFGLTNAPTFGIDPLRHDITKLDLTIPLLSLWCIDINLSIQSVFLTLYMTWVHYELYRKYKSCVPCE